MQTTDISYADAALENRCAPRTKLAIPSQLSISGGKVFNTVVHDLSVAGFSASSICRLTADQVCWLTLPGMPPAPGRIVWWDRSIAGAAFDNLLDTSVFDDIIARWASPLGGGVTRSCLL